MIEIAGDLKSGGSGAVRHEIVHPQGQAPLTGLCIALAVERMLGLVGGQAPAPGLYFPELLLEPAHVVAQMKAHGARFATAKPRTPV